MKNFRIAAMGVTFGGLTALAALAGAQTLTIYHSGSDEPVVVSLSSVEGEELVIAADGSVTAYTPDSIVTTPPKDPPTCSNTSRSVQQGNAFSLNLAGLCTDPENILDPGSTEILSQPDLGSVTTPTSQGTVLYEANANDSGTDSFTFRVADSEGTFSNTATVTVNVTENSVNPGTDVPAYCAQRVNTNLTKSNASGTTPDGRRWDNTKLPWIDESGFSLTRNHKLARGSYAAMEFTIGNEPNNGTVAGSVALENTIYAVDSSRMISISECPGDFTYEMPRECRQPQAASAPTPNTPSLNWQIGGTSRFACILEPNKTYYFNVVNADNLDFPATTCTTSECGFSIATNSN